MSSFEQVPFEGQKNFNAGEFADNPEQRCPCLLLLDNSGSMAGRPISELNAGLTLLRPFPSEYAARDSTTQDAGTRKPQKITPTLS
jgi:hypothetical protein